MRGRTEIAGAGRYLNEIVLGAQGRERQNSWRQVSPGAVVDRNINLKAGETYVAVENPRGELGCYLVSDGSGRPYRMHIRGASFYNLQTLSTMVQGGLVADGIAIISSIDPIMGDVDR